MRPLRALGFVLAAALLVLPVAALAVIASVVLIAAGTVRIVVGVWDDSD